MLLNIVIKKLYYVSSYDTMVLPNKVVKNITIPDN